MQQPKVSILIPLYNSEKYISDTIQSCLAQTYPNIEIVIIDDGSTDNSYQIAKKFEDYSRLRVYQQPNLGASKARNRAFESSTGDYIQFLDADDCLSSNKIERQIIELQKTNTDVNICSIGWYNQNMDILERITSFNFHNSEAVSYAISSIFTSLAPLYSRRLVESIKGYDTELNGAQDWDFNLRIALLKPKYSFCAETLVYVRDVQHSLSSDYIKISKEAGKVLIKLKSQIKTENLSNLANEKIFWIFFVNVRANDQSAFDELIKHVRGGHSPKRYNFLKYKILAKLYFVIRSII